VERKITGGHSDTVHREEKRLVVRVTTRKLKYPPTHPAEVIGIKERGPWGEILARSN